MIYSYVVVIREIMRGVTCRLINSDKMKKQLYPYACIDID